MALVAIRALVGTMRTVQILPDSDGSAKARVAQIADFVIVARVKREGNTQPELGNPSTGCFCFKKWGLNERTGWAVRGPEYRSDVKCH